MHNDAPAGTNYTHRAPDTLIRTVIVPERKVTVTYYGTNPMIGTNGETISGMYEHEYQYDVDLTDTSEPWPLEPWDQVESEIYWLDIVAMYPEDASGGTGNVIDAFGWKTADPNQQLPPGQEWIDDAVHSPRSGDPWPYPPPGWEEMRYGPDWGGYEDYYGTSINMAFQLNPEERYVFGWKTADPNQTLSADQTWIDDAVSSTRPGEDTVIPYPPMQWYEMTYGPYGMGPPGLPPYYYGGVQSYQDISINMAYGLTVSTETEPPPPPEVGYDKWIQLPDTNWGFDIWSWGIIDDAYDTDDFRRYSIGNEVAEDWRCFNGRAITKVTWWGSLNEYEEDTPDTPPMPDKSALPDAFLLSMHHDIPMGGGYHYSQPGTPPIQTVEIPISKVKITYYDSNPKIDHTTGQPIAGQMEHEYKFQTVLEDPWPQDTGTIYWLDIVGLYDQDRITKDKWTQPPDLSANGTMVRAEHPVKHWDGGGTIVGQVVADDWRCNDSRPIKGLRWWGSYFNKAYEPADTEVRNLIFEISWHTGDTGTGGTLPGGLNSVTMQLAQEKLFTTDANGTKVYEYFTWLAYPFDQEFDGIYWVDIEMDLGAPRNWPYNTWGWRTTNQGWRNNACICTSSGHNGPWTSIDKEMAFELLVEEEIPHIFGWKIADVYDTPPDPYYGWIDDAVSIVWPPSLLYPPSMTPYPPTSWYAMTYGPLGGGVQPPYYYGGRVNYHYKPGQGWYPSIGMAFILDTKPKLIIEAQPGSISNARLRVITDPAVPFAIWYNFNMDDISDSTWSLLPPGTFPAGTKTIIDTGVLAPGPPKQKFYILKE